MADKRKLQRLIDACVKANNAVIKAEQSLNEYCDQTWGFAPSDRDMDNILDNVYGGCGGSEGMAAKEFIEEMDEETGKT